MAKQISYDTTAREHIKNGVMQLARTVKITLGPRGRNVIIEKSLCHIAKAPINLILVPPLRSPPPTRREEPRLWRSICPPVPT